ncbi:UBP1-associated protein 2C-like protein, partial [Tanacetum coccineum]
GTAFIGVVEELKKLTTSVAHVLPVFDDGGSTAEIVRVLGGPAFGDIRSRCLRLSDQSTSEAFVVCTLLGFRLPLDARQAKLEWYSTENWTKMFGPGPGWSGQSEEGARRAVVDSVKSIDGHQVMCKMAVDGKKERAGGGMMSPRGPVPGIVNTGGRTSYSGYPGGPSLLPHQNPPPSGTGSGPGYVNQVPPSGTGSGPGYVNQVPPSGTGSGPGYVNQGPPSHSSNGYPAGTGYNNGGYASAVAAAAPEYPGQNSYRPLMNRLPPIQGGFADSGNYGPSSGYPTQPNMPPAGPRGPHGGMYQGGHPYY